ncbi:MAG: S41 family peptidase [Bacteroidetes bacterium]|nr:S41 family peptidase [Rhodothermia bacterium]MCS7156048.1 S41 family peptidase [Bacteroidota bacterium]MCX7907736.1 S41 family peptidase [Bacteroidota bacterium]MDW8137865.1 S41 family peptidase [Bacteroidota bacterium]MDW8286284.1 S41 family peptidase [Bacteroidota bacterium]
MRPMRFVLPLGLAALLSLGFFQGSDRFFELRKHFTIFSELYTEISTHYVDEVPPAKLIRGALEGMLELLDPYTNFIDETQRDDVELTVSGRYGGVGLSIAERDGRIVVLRPLEGYSAFRQGIRAGDVILQVNGQSVSGLSTAEVSALLRGEPNTTVSVTIAREGEARPLEFVLVRERVRLQDVTYAGWVQPGIGYVRLERFSEGAPREFAQALDRLRREGPLEGLILDLRGNPGGLLEAAVAVVGHFLPRGSLVVTMRGRKGVVEREFRTSDSPTLPNMPLVVLVDRESASASEIVAGALQDLDRAVVMGERTFGKGLVQVIRPLSYNTAVKITTAKYYTPSGRCIQAVDYAEHTRNGGRLIPDSLRRAFRTSRGRIVYDGVGIEPDVRLAPPPPSALEEALRRRMWVFEFANRFAARYRQLPDTFTVSDAVYAEFGSFLRERGFAYETQTERRLSELVEAARAEGFYEALRPGLEALQRALDAEKGRDLLRHAGSLKEELRREILARYYGSSRLIALDLERDPLVDRAIALLRDPQAYRRVLGG